MKGFWATLKCLPWWVLLAGSTWGALPSDDWMVRLADGNGERSASAPLRLQLPDEMPEAVRADLIYELDGVDISDTVKMAPDGAVELSQQPLGLGDHRFRLIYAPPGGRWSEIGVWGFTVVDRANGIARSSEEGARALSAPIGRQTQLQLTISQPAAAPATPLAESLYANPATGFDERPTDADSPQQIRAVLSSGSMAVQLGNQKLPYESLIHDGRELSGTSANWTLDDETQLLGFGMRTPGQGEFHGAILEHAWPAPGHDQFSLTGAWISSNSRDAEASAYDGKAWSLAGEATFMARRLRLQLEYAGSHSGVDTSDGSSGDEEATTYRLQTELHSRQQAALQWRLGVEQRRVAPAFFSLANPALEPDRLTLRTYGDLTFERWRFDWSMEQWRNNLQRDRQTDMLRARNARVAATWAPEKAFGLGFLGKPSYKIAAELRRVRAVETSTATDPTSPNSGELDVALQTEFARDGWLWGMSAKTGRSYRTADTRLATRSVALDLYGDLTALAWLSAKPNLSWEREYQPGLGVLDEKWSAKLVSSRIELQKDLSASLAMEHAHWTHADDTKDASATRVGGRLIWMLRRPKTQKNGLSLTLAGSYSERSGLSESNSLTEGYGLMLSFSSANLIEGD